MKIWISLLFVLELSAQQVTVNSQAITAVQGNGAKAQLSTGSTTTNDCVKFDANGNTVDAGSACGAGGGGTGNAAATHSVTFSATPTYTCSSASAGTVEEFTLSTALSANVTSSTLATCTAGEVLNFTYTQSAASGPFTVVMPTNFDACPVSPTASAVTTCGYSYDGTNGRLVGSTSNDTPSVLLLSATRAAPTVVPSGGAAWPDSTDNDFEYRQTGGGSIFKMFLSGGDANPVTGVVSKINGTAFSGTSGHLVSFGAANIPADSGVVAANAVVASSPGTGIAHFAGSTQTVTSSAVALGDMATQATNTVLGNFTSGTAVPTATAVASCSGNNNGTIYTTNTGFGCGASFAQLNIANIFTSAGTINLNASTQANGFRLPNQTPAAPTTAGSMIYDTTLNMATLYNGAVSDVVVTSQSAPGVTTGSTCGSPTVAGNDHYGIITAGAVTTCTLKLTFAFSAANGWSCQFNDQTTVADTVHQHSNTVTSATTNAATIVSGDLINYTCGPF